MGGKIEISLRGSDGSVKLDYMDEQEFDRINWHLPAENKDQMQCRKYAAVAFSCHTPKNHLRSWYAYGRGADCKRERDNLWNCLRLKMAKKETRERLLADNAKANAQ